MEARLIKTISIYFHLLTPVSPKLPMKTFLTFLWYPTFLCFHSPLGCSKSSRGQNYSRTVRRCQNYQTFCNCWRKPNRSILSENTMLATPFLPPLMLLSKSCQRNGANITGSTNDDRLESFWIPCEEISEAPICKYSILRMTTRQFISVNYKKGKLEMLASLVMSFHAPMESFVIDIVFTPTTDDLFQCLQKDGRFTIFTKAITASRQGKLFQNMHSLYTTFAPTDEPLKTSSQNRGIFIPSRER